MRSFAAVVAVGVIAWSNAALAEDVIPEDVTQETVLGDETKKEEAKKPDGWADELSLSGTGSLTNSRKVVGAIDGTTAQLGAVVKGSAVLTRGQHQWETTLELKESQTRTPQVPAFIKSADDLTLKSTYVFHLQSIKWLGPYGRARASSQLFHGYDVLTDPVTVVRTTRDGTTVTKAKPALARIAVTQPFEPLLIRESAGLFANPIEEKKLALKTKLGAGAQHILVRDGFALADDEATPEREYLQLETSTQAGAELDVALSGALAENITWSAGAELFYPLYTSVDTGLSGTELLVTELSGKLTVRLTKWASLDYVVSAKKIPLVLDAWQVQNGLLLTVGFDLI
jgi:hypothetical protein